MGVCVKNKCISSFFNSWIGALSTGLSMWLYIDRWVIGSLCSSLSDNFKRLMLLKQKKIKPHVMTISNIIWVLSSSRISCVTSFRFSVGSHCIKHGENLLEVTNKLFFLIKMHCWRPFYHSMNGIILKTQSRLFIGPLLSHQSFLVLWLLFGNPSMTVHF